MSNCVNKSSELYKELETLYTDRIATIVYTSLEQGIFEDIKGSKETGFTIITKIGNEIVEMPVEALEGFIQRSSENTLDNFGVEEESDAINSIVGVINGIFASRVFVIRDGKKKKIPYKKITKQDIIDNPKLDLKTRVIGQTRGMFNDLYKATPKVLSESNIQYGLKLLSHLEEFDNTDSRALWYKSKSKFRQQSGIDISEISEAQKENKNNKLSRNFDELAFAESTNKTVSEIVKEVLSSLTITKYVGDNIVTETSELFNLPKYYNSSDILNRLKHELIDIVDKEDMMNRLAIMGNVYFPSAKQIIEKLEANPELKLAFFSAFNTTMTKSNYVGYTFKGKEIDLVVDEDNLSPAHVLSNSWISMVNLYIQRKLYDDKLDKINELVKEYNELTSTKFDAKTRIENKKLTIPVLAKAFKYLGIIIPEETITFFMRSSGEDTKFVNIDNKTIHGVFYDVLITILEANAKNDSSNKLVTGALNKLADAIVKYTTSFSEIMYTGVDGNKRYLVKHPSLLSDFQKLITLATDEKGKERLYTYLMQFKEDASIYNELNGVGNPNLNSNWLFTKTYAGTTGKIETSETIDGFLKLNENNEWILNDNFISKFRTYLFGGLKNYSNNVGIDYKNISDVDWALALLANYISPHRLKQEESTSWVGVPIKSPSDASITEFMLVPRVALFTGDYRVISGKYELSQNSIIFYRMFNIFNQEVARMRNALDVLVEKENGKYIKDDLGNYKIKDKYIEGSEEYDEQALNDLPSPLIRNKQGKIIKNGKLVGTMFKFHAFSSLNDLDIFNAQGAINLDVANTKVAEIKNAINEQLTDRGNTFIELMSVHNKVAASHDAYFNNKDVNTLWFEMYMNHFMSNVEYENFISGTPSEYQNPNDANKRASAPIKHGITPFEYSDKKVKFVIIKDAIITNMIYDKLNARAISDLKALGYTEDTPEFDKLLKEVMSNYNGIVAGDAQTYMSTRFAINVLTARGSFRDVENIITENGIVAAPKESISSIQPIKSVIVERSIREYDGVKMLNSLFIKHSEFPAEIDFGTELKELFDELAEHGIEEIVFESAIKSGLSNQVEIVDKNGNLIRDNIPLLLDNTQEYSLHNYRIQQEVPDHIRDTSNKLARQISKHIFANLRLDEKYDNDMTGSEMFDELQSLFAANIFESARDIYKDLGIAEDATGFYELKDIKRISKILIEHGIRNNFSDEEIRAVKLNILGQFNMPISYNEFIYKWMAALGSIITNRIVEQKFPGMHLVAVANTLQKATSQNNGKFVKLSDSEFTKDIDKLRVIEDGDTLIFEIAIPAWSKDFLNDDGSPIPIEQLPEDIRDMIAFRIPTSGKHSAVVARVVKILPTSAGSIVIAPDEIVGKLGMDFDIDTLFFMIKKHRLTKDGIIAIPYDISEEGLKDAKIRRILKNHPNVAKEYFGLLKHINNIASSLTGEELNDDSIVNIDEVLTEQIEDLTLDLFKLEQLENLANEEESYDEVEDIQDKIFKIKDSIYGKQYKQEKILKLFTELEELEEKLLLTFEYYFTDLSTIDIVPKAARNNRILDLMKTILNDRQSFLENFKPAAYENSVDLANKFNRNITTPISCCPLTQILYRSSAQNGKNILELAASITANTVVLQNVKAKLLDGDGFSVTYHFDLLPFNLTELKEMYGDKNVESNGSLVTINHTRIGRNADNSYHSIKGRGYLITDEVAQLVDHAADAVKNSLLDNLSTYTAPIYETLISTGVPMEYAAALISQPIIHQYNKLKARQDGIRNDIKPFNIEHSLRAYIIKQLYMAKYPTKANDPLNLYKVDKKGVMLINKLEFLKATKHVDYLNHLGYTPSEEGLTEHELTELATEKKIDWAKQLDVLNLFLEHNKVTKTVTQYNMILSVDKTGLSPKFASGRDLTNKILKLSQPKDSGEFSYTMISEVTGTRVEKAIYPSLFDLDSKSAYPVFDNYLKYGYIIPLDTLSKLFITETEHVIDIEEGLKYYFPGLKYNDNSNTRFTGLFHKKIMETVFNGHTMFSSKSQHEIDIAIGRKTEEGSKSVPESILEVREILNLDINKVHLLNWLQPQLTINENSKIDYHQIIVPDSDMSNTIDIFKKNFLDMFLSKDKRVSNLAIGLIQYLQYTKGLMYGYNSYSKYIPLDVKTMLGFAKYTQHVLDELNNGNGESVIPSEILTDFIVDNINSDLVFSRVSSVPHSKFATGIKPSKLRGVNTVLFLTRTTFSESEGFLTKKYVLSDIIRDKAGFITSYKYQVLPELTSKNRDWIKNVVDKAFRVYDNTGVDDLVENEPELDEDAETEESESERVYTNHAMNRTMSASENLTGKSTTTLKLIEQGLRTATTRSYPLGKVGDIITFENRPQKYKITQTELLTNNNTIDENWIKEWSKKEQWTVEYFKKILGGTTVHVGSYQTTFKKIEELEAVSEIKGINISSYETGLGAKLTNFAKLPILFNNKFYESSETAYQKNKKDLSDLGVKKLMIEVLLAKLQQYPELVEEINKLGGLKFLNESTHNLIKNGKIIKEDRWTGKDGLFMQSLRIAYDKINNSSEGTQLTLFERSSYGEPMTKELADRQAKELEQQFASIGIDVTVKYDENVATHQVDIVDGKAVITLNPNTLRTTSVFHEFGHILIELVEDEEFIQQGISQLKDSELWNQIAELYPELSEEHLAREVLTTAIGMEASELFSEKEKVSKFQFWLNRLFDRFANFLFKISRGKIGKEISVAKTMALKLVNNNVKGIIKDKYEARSWQEKVNALKESILSNVQYVEKRMNALESQKIKYRDDIGNYNAWQYNKRLAALEKKVNTAEIYKLLENTEDEKALLDMVAGVNAIALNDIEFMNSVSKKLEVAKDKYLNRYTKGNELTFEEGIELGKTLDGAREFFEIFKLAGEVDVLNKETLDKEIVKFSEETQKALKVAFNSLRSLKYADTELFNKMVRDYEYLKNTTHKSFIIANTTNKLVADYLAYFDEYNFDENYKQRMFGALIHSNNPLAANLASMIRLADNRINNEFREKNKTFQKKVKEFLAKNGVFKSLFNKYGELHKEWLMDEFYEKLNELTESGIVYSKAIRKLGTILKTSDELTGLVASMKRKVIAKEITDAEFGKWFSRNIKEKIDDMGEVTYFPKFSGIYYKLNDEFKNKEYIRIMSSERDSAMYNYLSELFNDLFSEYSTVVQKYGVLPAMFSKEAKDKYKKEAKKKEKEAKETTESKLEEFIEKTNIFGETFRSLNLPSVGYLLEETIIHIPKKKQRENYHDWENRVIDIANNFKPNNNFTTVEEVKKFNSELIKKNKLRHGELANYNLEEVIPRFIESTLHYKEYKEIEANVLMTLETLKTTKPKEQAGGKSIIDRGKTLLGKDKQKEKDGVSNVYNHAKDFVKMIYYGEFNDDGKTELSKKSDKALDALKNYRALTSMGLNFFSGTKNITYGGFMTAIEGLSSIHFSTKDVREIEGLYNLNIASFQSDIFTGKSRRGEASTYAGALIKRFNIIESYNDLMEHTPELTKNYLAKLSTDVLFFMMEKGEHMMQNKLLFAMMNSHRVINNKIVSLADYIGDYNAIVSKEERAKYKTNPSELKRLVDEKKALRAKKIEEFKKHTKLLDAFEFIDGHAEIKKTLSELPSEEIDRFRMKVQGISHKLHGIYNKSDKGAIEATKLGQHLMQFRHWAIPGWDKRFGARGGILRIDPFWDEMMQEQNIGDYKAFGKLLSMPYKDIRDEYIANKKNPLLYSPLIALQSLARLVGNTRLYWNSMNMYEKAGAKRAIAEFAAIAMVSLLLRAAIPDDDDKLKHNRHYNFLLVQLDATKTELRTYLPVVGWINEGLKIMQNPTATFGLMYDLVRLTNAIIKYPFLDEEETKFKGGYYHGQSKIIIYGSRSVPVGNMWRRWNALDNQTRAYKLYSGQ